MPTEFHSVLSSDHGILPAGTGMLPQPSLAAAGREPHGGRAAGLRGLKRRLAGPGGVYTLGNVLGLIAGLTIAACHRRASGHGPGAASLIVNYLVGSPSASLMTLATLIFFVSGEAYHRARSGLPGSTRALSAGDFYSGCGALALGAGLFMLGDPLLAMTSGVLHAGGKFGSAVTHWTKNRGAFACDLTFRSLVLCSRLPAMTLAIFALLRLQHAPLADFSLPATMLVCTALWAIADLMLLSYAFLPINTES